MRQFKVLMGTTPGFDGVVAANKIPKVRDFSSSLTFDLRDL